MLAQKGTAVAMSLQSSPGEGHSPILAALPRAGLAEEVSQLIINQGEDCQAERGGW